MSQVGSLGRRVSALSAAALVVGLATAAGTASAPAAAAPAGVIAPAPAVAAPVGVQVGSRASAAVVAAPRIRLASVGRDVKVNIDPNLSGSKSWTFLVRRSPLGSSKPYVTVGTYRTWGSHERRSLTLPRGDYRVIVPAQHGRPRAVSFVRHRADVTPGAVQPSSASITLGLPQEPRGLVVLRGRATDTQSGIARVEVWRGTTRLGLAGFNPQPPSRTGSVMWEWRGMVPGDWRTLKVRPVDLSRNIGAFVAVPLGVAPTPSTRWTQVDGNCGVTVAGAAYCWGNNAFGQLGRGDTVDSAVPVPVQGLSSGVRSISSGGTRACAVTDANEVWCWGSGRLGDGGTSGSTVPVKVTGLPAASAVDVSYDHSCALTVAGAAYCWGENRWGGLGDGTTAASNSPVPVTGLGEGTTAQVRVGGERSCALTTAGAVRCWGGEWNDSENPGSQLSALWPTSSTPVPVPGLGSGVAQLRLDGGIACVITTAGKGRCWGTNATGEEWYFGYPRPTTPAFLPAISEPLVDLATIGIDGVVSRTCGVTASGALTCWDWEPTSDGYEEVLLPVTPEPARPVVGLASGVADVSPGCVVTTAGVAYCWRLGGYPWAWTDPPSTAVLDLVAVPDPT